MKLASANAKGVNNMGDGPIESVETMMGTHQTLVQIATWIQ